MYYITTNKKGVLRADVKIN